MNINELIDKLQDIKAKYGNLPCRTSHECIADGSRWFADIEHVWISNDPETNEKVVEL